jgi:hypothetical protein
MSMHEALMIHELVATDEDSDESSPTARKRSRKYTTSDFMRDFEEEEAMLTNDSVADDFEVRTTRSSSSAGLPRTDSRSPNEIRVLLNADESAKHDLHFGIDGLAATIELKVRLGYYHSCVRCSGCANIASISCRPVGGLKPCPLLTTTHLT